MCGCCRFTCIHTHNMCGRRSRSTTTVGSIVIVLAQSMPDVNNSGADLRMGRVACAGELCTATPKFMPCHMGTGLCDVLIYSGGRRSYCLRTCWVIVLRPAGWVHCAVTAACHLKSGSIIWYLIVWPLLSTSISIVIDIVAYISLC